MADLYLKSMDIPATGNTYKIVQPDGYYPDMTAGQITTNIHDTNSVPYVFRPTPFNSTRESGDIVGASVAWKQIAKGTSFSSRTLTLGLTIAASSADDSITVNGTASSTNNLYFWSSMATISNHIYFFQGAHNHGGNSGLQVPVGTGVFVKDTGNGAIFKNPSSAQMQFFFTSGDSFSNEKFYPQLFDLTQMLGSTIADYIYTLESGTAGAGIAKLREWGFFDKPYYAYNAGSIESVNVSKHRMTGLNQWDEEWDIGSITNDGQPTTGSYLRSKNYIPVLGGTDYYFGCSSSITGWIYAYDANFNFVSLGSNGYKAVTFGTSSDTFPQNVAYIKFLINVTYGTTYKNDICINISNPAVNGTYEPYTVNEYPLDSDLTLRGILKLDGSNNLYADGDVYEADGTVTRKYGIVDLGTLNFTRYSTTDVYRITTASINMKKPASSEALHAVCPKFVAISQDNASSAVSGDMWAHPSNGYFNIMASGYADAAAFIAAMSGVYMVYELDTTSTETADSFQSPQVCSPYGTEEFEDHAYLLGYRDVKIPVGHNTSYAKNIVGAIEGIPLPPTTNGNFKLRCTVASGVPTYSWVSE